MAADVAKRKLTTILAADVVDYSKLMAADEEGTLATLKTSLDIAGALVDQHNGRVFKTAGDAFLAEFASAVEAVRAAIAIQEDLAARNAERPAERQMWLRIGINIGDVIVEGDDLFGDGVNVAARLEGLAEKGGICISGNTFEQVKNKLSIAFDDIGRQPVKNIPEPIPAFRIVPGAVAVTAAAGASPAAGAGRGWLWLAVAAVAAVVAGAYVGGLVPGAREPTPVAVPAPTPPAAPATPDRASAPPAAPVATHPFDGLWRVSIGALSGCVNNDPRAFPLRVEGGRIDQPHPRRPKTGTVSTGGEVTIDIADETGAPVGTITATIEGDAGTGRLVGRKPTCTGDVSFARAGAR